VKLANRPTFDQFRRGGVPRIVLTPEPAGADMGRAGARRIRQRRRSRIKLLEERVRAAGGFKKSDIGVNLMRAAFKPAVAHSPTPRRRRRAARIHGTVCRRGPAPSRTRVHIARCPTAISVRCSRCSCSCHCYCMSLTPERAAPAP